jgi:hypothetical protein
MNNCVMSASSPLIVVSGVCPMGPIVSSVSKRVGSGLDRLKMVSLCLEREKDSDLARSCRRAISHEPSLPIAESRSK